jgi:DNA primase
VLVEGNLDVIASHQAGVRNVVATAGTALTEQHLKAISRFTGDVRLAFDEDKAGQAATERSIPIASKVGVRLSIITIPAGKDPDELIKKDPKLWEEAIGKSEYAVDWLIERYAKILDLEKAPDKREFSDVTLATVRQLTDSVEQDHFVAKIAKILGVSSDAIRSKLQKPDQSKQLRKTNVQPMQFDKLALERKKLQDQLMALGLMRPSLRTLLDEIEPEMLPEEQARTLFSYLREHSDFDGKLVGVKGLKEVTEYIKIISLQYETLYQDQDDVELSLEAKRLRTRLIEQYVKTKKSENAHALQDADDRTTTELLEQARTLDALLKRFV